MAWVCDRHNYLNNARDHSGGSTVIVTITKTAVHTEMSIQDNGVGIFRKIQQKFNLLDERHAIFELSKGKLTTDPSNHSGEGIFFTSRMFDAFQILSGGCFFDHEIDDENDWLLENTNPRDGTIVLMKLNNHTARTTQQVYDRFTSGEPNDQGFSKTVVPVKLAQYGNDKLVSRSQAKRVMARVDRFKTVVLNFKDVPSIGQAFADEVFRVFPLDHPMVSVVAIQANDDVRKMIRRAQANAGSPELSALHPTQDEVAMGNDEFEAGPSDGDEAS